MHTQNTNPETVGAGQNSVKHTPGPWFYVSGAVWTTPNGPDDGGECIAQRTSDFEPTQRDANLRAIALLPFFEERAEFQSRCADELAAERDTLKAENERLRSALEEIAGRALLIHCREPGHVQAEYISNAARAALNAKGDK